MSETIVSLGPTPTRNQLRQARAALAPLARLGMPDAIAELDAVDRLMRELFPKRVADRVGESPRRRRRKRRNRRRIERVDCKADCPICLGEGRLVQCIGPMPAPRYPRRPEWRGPTTREMLGKAAQGCTSGNRPLANLCAVMLDARRVRLVMPPESPRTGRSLEAVRKIEVECWRCNGAGEIVVGTPEHDLENSAIGNFRRKRTYRGELVEHRRVSDPGHCVAGHDRGFLGGRFVGDPGYGAKWCYQPGVPGSGASSIDESAHREGRCVRAMRTLEVDERPRGKKLLDRRDKTTLAPGGERRAKMERRVQRYNAEWRKANPGPYTYGRKSRLPDVADLLRRMGVDVSGLVAQLDELPPTPDAENPLIAEARRRGDLAPDDARSGAGERLPWVDWREVEEGDLELIGTSGPRRQRDLQHELAAQQRSTAEAHRTELVKAAEERAKQNAD